MITIGMEILFDLDPLLPWPHDHIDVGPHVCHTRFRALVPDVEDENAWDVAKQLPEVRRLLKIIDRKG